MWLASKASDPDHQCSTYLGSGSESVSDIDDPFEFAENVRNLSTGIKHESFPAVLYASILLCRSNTTTKGFSVIYKGTRNNGYS